MTLPADLPLPDGPALAAWLARLVRIPSVSPEQAGPRAGVAGEARLAEAVAGWFGGLGAEVHQEEVEPGRPNVYGIWRGASDRWLAVDVHLDTVGVEQMTDEPFSGRIAGGRVHGRGAVDTKATLAVVLALLEAGRRPAASLLVAATIDEECGFRGAPAFVRWARARGIAPDELAVAEPTNCRPVHAHKGTMRPVIEIRGVSAHACQPELGRNAIAAAAPLLLAIEEENRRLQAAPRLGGPGAPTLTVTLIAGGIGENIVPDSCRITVDRRLVGGEDPAAIVASLGSLARKHCPLPVEIRAGVHTLPFLQSPDAP